MLAEPWTSPVWEHKSINLNWNKPEKHATPGKSAETSQSKLVNGRKAPDSDVKTGQIIEYYESEPQNDKYYTQETAF